MTPGALTLASTRGEIPIVGLMNLRVCASTLVAAAFALISVATVVISPSEATLDVGGTQQFSAQLFRNGSQARALFTWSSSNPKVATVSSAGLVMAVGAGEATITAIESSKQRGTAHVIVRRPLPRLVAKIAMGGAPFGSAVTKDGMGWIGQSRGSGVARLDIAGARLAGLAITDPMGSQPVELYPNVAGTRLYAVHFGGIITSINTATLAIADTARIGGDGYGIIATPAGDTVFAGATNGAIYKIALAQGEILGVLNLTEAAGYHFVWSQDRTRLYASARGSDGGHVYEIDPHGFHVLRTFETGDSPQAMTLSADGTKLLIAAEAGDVTVWDIATNSRAGTFMTGCKGYGIVREPRDSRLYVSCVLQGAVVVLDAESGAILTRFNVGGRPRELSVDPTTGSVLVPNEGGWVDIIR